MRRKDITTGDWLAFFICVPILVIWCTPEQVQEAKSAANQAAATKGEREFICAMVERLKDDKPELAKLHDLCEAGENLETIAANFAGYPAPYPDGCEQ